MVPGGGGDGTADLRGGGRGGGGTTGDWLRDSGTADLGGGRRGGGGLCFTPAPGGLDYVMTWSVANLATAVTGGRGRGVCHWRIDRSQHFRSLLLPQKERSCHIHFNLQQVPNYVNVSVRRCFVSSFLSLVALTKDKEDKTPSHGLCSAGSYSKRKKDGRALPQCIQTVVKRHPSKGFEEAQTLA
ncbi:uncharacterized protein LOC125324980 isoform X3 [Corvus hawaiiensis]|uniref:uncharacterized protein LOC125324980 isoform X3 n=1 Tax=Corvus hawaiiensis TaxID=134902 RepID=UPI002019A4C1|nr:uncharacterized protein LOC125324980 isoform X3 [Corvus hawaiiensis]